MAMYWLLFFMPAVAVFSPMRLDARTSRLAWVLTGLFFTVIIGLRYQTGGDWYNYLLGFDIVSRLPFLYALGFKDPGYSVLNWIVFQLGGSILWVNLFCASVLMYGTVDFCRTQPRPWLALLVAVPYMLIVVGMGYTRQATALGFALTGLVALGQSRVLAFVFWITLGALFHKSAALLVPIAVFAGGGGRLWKGLWVMIAAAIIYRWVLADSADALWQNYVSADMESYGAGVRVAMNSVPAVLFLVFRRRLNPGGTNDGLWMLIALLSLACIPLVVMSSTAVDRTALYFIPIQMYVFSRLPSLATSVRNRSILVLAIVAYYTAVQWTWLNLATHARYWVPYHFAWLS